MPETESGKQRSARKDETVANGQMTYRLVAEAPEGPIAESFRNLRAALSLLGPEAERKIFLFTSAVPSEGKSFTSANYALALAQQGHRFFSSMATCAVPACTRFSPRNSRAPATERKTAKPSRAWSIIWSAKRNWKPPCVPSPPMTSTSTSPVKGEKKFVTATGGQLSILAGGRRAPNPAELLSGHSFGQLMAKPPSYSTASLSTAPRSLL